MIPKAMHINLREDENIEVGAGTNAVIGGITSGFTARVELGNQLGEIGSDLKTIGNQALERASSALETVPRPPIVRLEIQSHD
jgi:hypothetical protein